MRHQLLPISLATTGSVKCVDSSLDLIDTGCSKGLCCINILKGPIIQLLNVLLQLWRYIKFDSRLTCQLDTREGFLLSAVPCSGGSYRRGF